MREKERGGGERERCGWELVLGRGARRRLGAAARCGGGGSPAVREREGLLRQHLTHTTTTPTTTTFDRTRMTTRASEVKNIWIAAGDGDLERVKVRLLIASRAATAAAGSRG
jgi:hypothetical protein